MLKLFSPKSETSKPEPLKDSDLYHMPLHGFRGKLSTCVEIGDRVKRYQLLADDPTGFSSSIHSPVSGEVMGEDPTGTYLIIKNDHQNLSCDVQSLSFEQMDKAKILDTIRTYGIEGSGGARFPTHIKYNIRDQAIDYFIINGVECEPHLSADLVQMLHYSDEIVHALKIIKKLINPQKMVLAIKKKNKHLKPIFLKSIEKHGIAVEIQTVPNTYPQGSENVLIKNVTNIHVRKGEVPAKYGVIVSNVGTIYALYQAFIEGIPYTERIMTLISESPKLTKNYIVKVGTPAKDLIPTTTSTAASSNKQSSSTWIFGGAMMGKQVSSDQMPVTKGTGGLIELVDYSAKDYQCIRCGYCNDACPQKLMPSEYPAFVRERNSEKLKEYTIDQCIECGACSYICPSNLPLAQFIKDGKRIANE